MAKNIYKQLTAHYTPELVFQQRKQLSFSENGKRYHCALSKPCCCAGFQVDGYIITEGFRCDKLAVIEKENDQWTEIFVELKGSDILHAIEQLEATLQHEIFRHKGVDRRLARVVGHSFPSNKSDTRIEKAKIRFLQQLHCELRCLKSGQKEVV